MSRQHTVGAVKWLQVADGEKVLRRQDYKCGFVGAGILESDIVGDRLLGTQEGSFIKTCWLLLTSVLLC